MLVGEEILHFGQRHGRNRQRFGAHLRREPVHAQSRLPLTQIRQAQHIARIDQVRVLDLRVGLPDFRPQPRLVQESFGDIPERVTLLHHVGVGMIGPKLGGHDAGSNGQQRCRGNCKKFFKHGFHLPDSPSRFAPLNLRGI